MPKIKGSPKEKTTVGIDPLNFRLINAAMDKKEFSTVTDLVNTALAFYFENRDKPEKKNEVKEWLVSEEGEEYIKKIIRKVREKE